MGWPDPAAAIKTRERALERGLPFVFIPMYSSDFQSIAFEVTTVSFRVLFPLDDCPSAFRAVHGNY